MPFFSFHFVDPTVRTGSFNKYNLKLQIRSIFYMLYEILDTPKRNLLHNAIAEN